MSQALTDPIFAKLSSALPNLIKKITAHQADNKPMPLQGPVDADAQRERVNAIIARYKPTLTFPAP
ncbi:MAG: hypothetical protein COB66_00130 [Coxiella sp. (in: Bacteria)]|nr:MAG: hypothetical protein COB66_00130 [Coxiella sp. (in: g-proteobacteria)]